MRLSDSLSLYIFFFEVVGLISFFLPHSGCRWSGSNCWKIRSSKVVRYVSEQGAFEFHYFFMRKFWMAYKCMGLVVMPGGAGERDWPSTFDRGVLDFCVYF